MLSLDAGHQFLRNLGIPEPKVAWQIDPFGHSALTPSLFRKFGYDFLVINRVSDIWKEVLIQDGNLEFVWAGSDLGE